jgi:TetR/AcrR family transcriptional regulator, regulator of autoinduction and epiphytic fitness
MAVGGSNGERRAYRSVLREEQARATRRAIVAAATELFVENGYAATTIDAVADRAGVSRRTVFVSVGGKPELLRRAWDFAVVGDDEPVTMADRPAVRRLQQQSDVRVAVRGWARVATGVSARVAPLARVLVAAADADPDVAELLAIVEEQRLTGARTFVSWVQSHGGLRRGVTTKRAAELCWVQIDPSVYRRLVLERGWTARQFERYLADVVEAAILPGRT